MIRIGREIQCLPYAGFFVLYLTLYVLLNLAKYNMTVLIKSVAFLFILDQSSQVLVIRVKCHVSIFRPSPGTCSVTSAPDLSRWWVEQTTAVHCTGNHYTVLCLYLEASGTRPRKARTGWN